MDHAPLHDVTTFEIVAPYTLRITFDDGTKQVIDFEPVLHGKMYAPLQDLALFNQVRLDAGNLVWPNEADFDPSDLHDWDQPGVGESLIEQAQGWHAREVISGE